jgi:hypothetical protein
MIEVGGSMKSLIAELLLSDCVYVSSAGEVSWAACWLVAQLLVAGWWLVVSGWGGSVVSGP